jgi:hypothetical protein
MQGGASVLLSDNCTTAGITVTAFGTVMSMRLGLKPLFQTWADQVPAGMLSKLTWPLPLVILVFEVELKQTAAPTEGTIPPPGIDWNTWKATRDCAPASMETRNPAATNTIRPDISRFM